MRRAAVFLELRATNGPLKQADSRRWGAPAGGQNRLQLVAYF